MRAPFLQVRSNLCGTAKIRIRRATGATRLEVHTNPRCDGSGFFKCSTHHFIEWHGRPIQGTTDLNRGSVKYRP